MSTFTTKDGTEIFYNDWGTGQPIVFSHTWPLGADSFEDQMFFLVNHGYRCIAHDRRGHGRSTQPWSGYDLDTYADDLATLIEKLDLKNIIHVGHSIGGGEVVRYLGRHGTSRASKAVLLAPATPLMLKTAANPGGQNLPSRVAKTCLRILTKLRSRVNPSNLQYPARTRGPCGVQTRSRDRLELPRLVDYR